MKAAGIFLFVAELLAWPCLAATAYLLYDGWAFGGGPAFAMIVFINTVYFWGWAPLVALFAYRWLSRSQKLRAGAVLTAAAIDAWLGFVVLGPVAM